MRGTYRDAPRRRSQKKSDLNDQNAVENKTLDNNAKRGSQRASSMTRLPRILGTIEAGPDPVAANWAIALPRDAATRAKTR